MEDFIKRFSSVPEDFVLDFYSIAKEHYDDNELVINFDIVVKWLRVSKGNLKRLLVKRFIENVDYKIIKINKAHRNGATHKENILLTPDCFKGICMLSQTDRASLVRNYYLSLEKLIRKYNSIIQDQLYKEIGILRTNQKAKINIKGGVIYILEASNNTTLNSFAQKMYKLGKTTNIKKRLVTYNSGNSNEIRPVFIIKVSNVDKVEGCVKNLVKEYQYRKYKEIYQIDIKLLKTAIMSCDELINGFKEIIAKNNKEVKKQYKRLKKTKNNLFIIMEKK